MTTIILLLIIYYISTLILNGSVAVLKYINQMPDIPLIIRNQFCSFKGIKLCNKKNPQLAKLLFYCDRSELNFQNDLDIQETSNFLPKLEDILSRDLGKLDIWVERNFMRVNKGKCKVLNLERSNSLAVDLLERGSVEKDLVCWWTTGWP